MRPLALSLACIGAAAPPVWGQVINPGSTAGFPAVGNVAAGTISGWGINGAAMNINQSSWRAVINWNAFSLAGGNSIAFNQAMGAGSVTLNRVTTVGNPSQIFGTITAPGHVFIINPAGVLFGAGSQVNVGGLVASTLDIADDAFAGGDRVNTPLAGGGTLTFTRTDAVTGKVSVEGGASITTTPGGTVALMGQEVNNAGQINVAQGSVGLLSGLSATLDYAGDGLTTFKVSNVTGNVAAKALVTNVGQITADGGRVNIAALSTDPGALVVNQQGLIQARSLESRNGEIVLSGGGGAAAPAIVAVGGTLDAGAAAGSGAAGGGITVEADTLRVAGASLRAGGATNGSVQLTSTNDVWVHAPGAAPADPGATTTVDAQSLASALNSGADLTLTNRSASTFGVAFQPDAQVLKTEGGSATFTVNSDRNIEMAANSAIRSKAGALNVAFNADANGSLAADGVGPVGELPARGAILLDHAAIETAGGDIRFYGQSDPTRGRAVGGQQTTPVPDGAPAVRQTAGIEVNDSLLSTCAAGVASCSNGGAITLRGEGSSWSYLTPLGGDLDVTGTSGVSVQGGTLRTGSGAVRLEGRGGFGIFSSGVDIGSSYDGSEFTSSRIESAGGDVVLVGSGRAWRTGDAVGTFMDAGNGVTLSSARISTGGHVTIDGTGGSLADAMTDPGFLALASGQIGTTFHSEGVGVDLGYSEIAAGAGRSIAITGTAGSPAFNVGKNAAGVAEVTPFDPASSILVQGGHWTAEGGRIMLRGGAGAISIESNNSDSTPDDPGLLISTASAQGRGGAIDISARNVNITGYSNEGYGYTRLDASGATGGGTIDIRAVGDGGAAPNGIAGVDANVVLAANATGSGAGGSIRVIGDNTLRAYGRIEARGGSAGGDGGFVETSGGAFDLGAISVDAGAPAGKAGQWLIDPYNVEISSTAGDTSLPGNPFVPLTNSVIRDSAINNALNGGTDVTITTGAGGNPTDGDIFLNNAQISYTGSGERTFRLDAHRSIRSNAGTNIASSGTGGPLNVVFNADANNSAATTGGGQISYSGSIYTNGGDVTMNAAWANASNLASVSIDGVAIDTRAGNQVAGLGYTGGSDALAGGDVRITGRTNVVSPFNGYDGVFIDGTRINTSTGGIDILGTAVNGSGVVIRADQGVGGLFSTTGNINVTGVGGYSASSAYAPGYGVVIGAPPFNAAGQPRISSVDGNITVGGLRQAGEGTGFGSGPGAGVRVGGNAQLTSTGRGDIEITGEMQGRGAGVEFAPTFSDTFGTQQGGIVSGARNVVLRAANDGSADALALGAGSQASAGGVMNLRPGGLNLTGTPEAYVATAADRTANAITVGGTAATGFAVSAAELTRIAAPTLVFGSNSHAADITVVGALNTTSALTLQNGGGGNIALNAPITAPTLGLVSAGNITQTAAALITAGTLLAQSSGGSVLLDQAANNVSAATLGGSAAGAFRYQDVDALRVGNVSVIGYDAAGNLPQVVATGSMAADTVYVRTLSGDLTLATNVSSSSGADLIAASRFQNAGAFTIAGAPWRVWADTWMGETRGGLAGSGLTPNLYHCAYLGLCTVSISPGDNHFIYAQQPVATVVINDANRFYGAPNPLFTYSITGLILGDRGLGFSGALSTTANAFSPPGFYPITGSFTSAEGYLVNVVPGSLRVNLQPSLPLPDVLREVPNTYTFDRNIGAPPICFATGPLGGDRAQQGDDLLAREWSRVRSRPNLTSCIDTERKNGCADF